MLDVLSVDSGNGSSLLPQMPLSIVLGIASMAYALNEQETHHSACARTTAVQAAIKASCEAWATPSMELS